MDLADAPAQSLFCHLPQVRQHVGRNLHGADDAPTDLDRIFLYRRPLLDYWAETGEPLWRIVRNVLIHECGHHFGLSDKDMARIEGEV